MTMFRMETTMTMSAFVPLMIPKEALSFATHDDDDNDPQMASTRVQQLPTSVMEYDPKLHEDEMWSHNGRRLWTFTHSKSTSSGWKCSTKSSRQFLCYYHYYDFVTNRLIGPITRSPTTPRTYPYPFLKQHCKQGAIMSNVGAFQAIRTQHTHKRSPHPRTKVLNNIASMCYNEQRLHPKPFRTQDTHKRSHPH